LFVCFSILCPQDQAIPQIGGEYVCPDEVQDSVSIFRFTALKSRPEFAGVVQQNQNITASDLVAFFIQTLEQRVGYTNFRLLENIDTTVNVTDPQTNETIATAPAKYVETTFLDDQGRRQERDFALVVLSNDGNTGYVLLPTISLFPRPEELSPEHQQVFDSFELVAPNSSSLQTNPGPMTSSPPQQEQQPSSPQSEQPVL
jgi:hypothetical protein